MANDVTVVDTKPRRPGVLIVGATSPIARAVAMEFARNGYDVITAARDQEENERIATDLRVRYEVSAYALPFDAEDFAGHAAFVDLCMNIAGEEIEGVVLCHGYMESQPAGQDSFEIARRTIDVNLTACISLLERFAARFGARGRGFIAGVSSVAGDRGRQSNYIYGCSKAGFSAYLQGLRNRMFHRGVSVTTIKPGFVDTRMTFGMKTPLMASPEAAGHSIFRAITKRRGVAYVPFFWRHIMLIITHIPEFVFKRLKM